MPFLISERETGLGPATPTLAKSILLSAL